jgi:hypothetical protein
MLKAVLCLEVSWVVEDFLENGEGRRWHVRLVNTAELSSKACCRMKVRTETLGASTCIVIQIGKLCRCIDDNGPRPLGH